MLRVARIPGLVWQAGCTHARRHASRLRDNPLKLLSDTSTVHLLGTMHIAEASAVAARKLIEEQHGTGRLGAVFLELDQSRYTRMREWLGGPSGGEDESMLQHAMSILSRPGRSPVASLFELGFSGIYRSLHKLGFASGVEFRAAVQACDKLTLPVILGDQDIRITMGRLAEGFRKDFTDIPRVLSLLSQPGTTTGEPGLETEVVKAFQAIAAGDIEQGQEHLTKLIDRETVGKLMGPMRRLAPAVSRSLIEERDDVMFDNLIEGIEKLPEGKRTVVMIVGLAHMQGISSRWEEREKRSAREYDSRG